MSDTFTVDLLWECARNLLDASADALTTAGLGAPQRQYVEVGTVPVMPLQMGGECSDQLVVVVEGPKLLQLPQAGATALQLAARPVAIAWAAVLTAVLYRCHPIPAGNALPNATDYDEMARHHLRDGWQMARALGRQVAHGTLFPALGTRAETAAIRMADLRTINPQGGVRGWTVPVSLHLPSDYDPSTGQ